MNKLVRAWVLGLGMGLLLGTEQVGAQLSPVMAAKDITQAEYALLPEYCIDTQAGPYGGPEGAAMMNRSPRAPKWVNLMGRDFWHMHHYCWGLRDLLRLRNAGLNAQTRQFLLGRAVAEFGYVINNCQPTMPLLPEVYLKRGETLEQMGNWQAAVESFDSSRKAKPEYWPAYDRWAALLVNYKQFDRARAIVDEGLAAMPDEPNLLARRKAVEAAAGQATRSAAKSGAAASGAHSK